MITRALEKSPLLAFLLILSLNRVACHLQLDEDQQTFSIKLKAKARTPNNTLIGTLTSLESMQPPFYIVPIHPDEPTLFNKDIRIDLDTGKYQILISLKFHSSHK